MPLLILAFLVPQRAEVAVGIIAMTLANLINHPHFGHSYQIFYRSFGAKLTSHEYPSGLRARYLVAGVVVPAVLGTFFVTTFLAGNAALMGRGVHAMLFLVGWHYVKQGYGMLAVDSTLKRRFLPDATKRLLLVNAYANWIMTWVILNNSLSSAEGYWGLEFAALRFPGWFTALAWVAGLATTSVTIVELVRLWRAGTPLPVNGLIAYAVSIYLWRLLPLTIVGALLVPVFHSLQYLVVVWRYQLNAVNDPTSAGSGGPRRRFAGFILRGTVIGAIGFWVVPLALTLAVPYDHAVFGPALFIFMAWVGINVHHYFLDTVIWRRANPDTRRWLFA